MLKPLSQWYCDVCDEIIEKPEDGYVIWKNDESLLCHDFRIVHQRSCQDFSYTSSLPISSFISDGGLCKLLSFLSIGHIKGNGENRIKNLDEFVDFFRRMQVPYYEEARRRFNNMDLIYDFGDSNEYYPYHVDVLKKIIENYAED